MHGSDVHHRAARGWAAFGKYKRELTNRHYPLRGRMKLYSSVVTPTVLYGSGTLTLTAAHSHKLRVEERKIMRSIVPTARRCFELSDFSVEEEPWVGWLVRATRRAEERFRRGGVQSWLSLQASRKCKFIERVRSCTDGRWSLRVLEWSPACIRPQGGPPKRFTD